MFFLFLINKTKLIINSKLSMNSRIKRYEEVLCEIKHFTPATIVSTPNTNNNIMIIVCFFICEAIFHTP